jgi:hypothetical protein
MISGCSIQIIPPRAGAGTSGSGRTGPCPISWPAWPKVSVSLPQGNFAGKIENLTSDRDILGQPLKFAALLDVDSQRFLYEHILASGPLDKAKPL